MLGGRRAPAPADTNARSLQVSEGDALKAPEGEEERQPRTMDNQTA